jgi:hypothetical protein
MRRRGRSKQNNQPVFSSLFRYTKSFPTHTRNIYYDVIEEENFTNERATMPIASALRKSASELKKIQQRFSFSFVEKRL